MEDLPLLRDIAVALCLAFVGGFTAKQLRLSPIVGYIVAGLFLSPFTPGYEADLHTLQELAEIGVVFLMFGVGLHFNLRDLMSVKGIAIPGAALQISIIALIGVGLGEFFGMDWRESLVLGLAVSVASTVVLVRALDERGLLSSIHGRVAIGWLIVEDLAVVFLLVLLPSLSPDNDNGILGETAVALGKATIFVVIMLVVGARLVPRILSIVARTGSRELFILSVIAGALGIATGAAVFGLSVALGAFIAGVVISETETSHQAAADVLPLREAFAVLFFVSVGMLMDPEVLRDNAGLLLAVLVLVVVGKSVVAVLVTAAFPYPARTGLVVAAGLAQCGEFSFIVAQEGLELDLIGERTYNVILAASVLSILLNPLTFSGIRYIEPMLRGVAPIWRIIDRQGPPPDIPLPRAGHVVIAGYGRVGELTGHALAQLGLSYIVVESNLDYVRRLIASGIPAVWGDAARPEVMDRASVQHARLLVVSVPDETSALLAVSNARRLNPALAIIVRARSANEIPEFLHLGANEIVVPEYEGGLEIMRQSLVVMGYDSEEALSLSNAVRDIHYQGAQH